MPNFFSALKKFSKQTLANLPAISVNPLYNAAHFSKQIFNTVSSRCVGKIVLGAMTLASQAVQAEAVINDPYTIVLDDKSSSPLHSFLKVVVASTLTLGTLILLCVYGELRRDPEGNERMHINLHNENQPDVIPEQKEVREIKADNFFESRLNTLKKQVGEIKNNSKKRKRLLSQISELETEFECPVSYEFMNNPVTLSTGHTYDLESLNKWFQQRRTCPTSGQIISPSEQLQETIKIKQLIDKNIKKLEDEVKRIPRCRG